MIRLSLERDKPELARVRDNIEKFKDQMKDDLAVVDENLKYVRDLKDEKKELKAKVVRMHSLSSPSELPLSRANVSGMTTRRT